MHIYIRYMPAIVYWTLNLCKTKNLCLYNGINMNNTTNNIQFLFQSGMDILGPDVHLKNIGRVHVVQFGPDGVFGWIFTDTTLVHQFLSGDRSVTCNVSECNLLPRNNAGVHANILIIFSCPSDLAAPGELLDNKDRSKRAADAQRRPDHTPSPLPRIPNPVACLASGDMIVFQLTINHTGS